MAVNKPIRIATRGSELALWQANHVKDLLEEQGVSVELVIIKTQGDKEQVLTFDKMEGKGFFTKEIEQALTDKTADLAVHSFKDLPTENPEGLIVAGVTYREDPADVLLVKKDAVDTTKKFNLKENAVVGTSSVRRKSQFHALRPDTTIEPLRGNVPTRINKLREGQYDAIILAAAGLERLKSDLSEFQVEKMDTAEFIPAPAQGVVALQIRSRDRKLKEILASITRNDVWEEIAIEREVLKLLEGGCQLPLGVFCEKDSDENGFDFFRIRTAMAESGDHPPVLLYTETYNPKEVAPLIVSRLRSIEPGKVFITRNLRKNDYFQRVLEGNGYKVLGKSLIDMRKVTARTPKMNPEWVFFASKHAVRFFFQQDLKLPANVKFGVVGKGTADELRRFGKKADFIGYSADVAMTGKQFEAVAGSSRVLFPQAKNSLRTVQKQMRNQDKIEDMIVYETLQAGVQDIPGADVIIFTSPSNVEAFFAVSSLPEDQKVVAMGDATGRALRKHKVKYYRQPASFDDIGLAQAVFGYIS